MVAGKVGDHGVLFLVDHVASEARTRGKLTDLVTRVAAERQACRIAAFTRERAPSSGCGRAGGTLPCSVVGCRRRPSPVVCPWSTESRVRNARRIACASYAPSSRTTWPSDPNLLSLRFDKYVEAVLSHCGYRVEDARAHLQAGLERLAEPLLASGALDEKSFEALYASMERAAEDARTVVSLVASYRHAISDIEGALQQPDGGAARAWNPARGGLLARAFRRAAHAQAGRTGGRLRPRLLLTHLQARRGLDLRESLARASSRTRPANARRNFARGRAHRTDVRISIAELLSPDVQEEDQRLCPVEFRDRGW